MTRQERAARTRCELVRAAAAQFERQGYVSTTLNGICRQVGVSSGALHFHFASKAALADVIEQVTSSTLQRLISASRPRRAGALQELVDISQLLVARMGDDQIIRSGVRLSQDVSRQGNLPFRQHWRAHVLALLEEARADGSLAPRVKIADAASAITLATEGAMNLGREDSQWPVVSSMAGFWRLMLPQLAAADFADRMDPSGTPP